MKRLLLALLLLAAPLAHAQSPSVSPTVLGCTNPAPAAPGASTVFFSSCKTPAFLPLSTSSVVASVSKTAPAWNHSLSGYKATDLIVACPGGATVSGATCTFNGADASALVAQSAVGTFFVKSPVVPSTVQGTLSWTAPTTNDDGTPITNLAGYNVYQDVVFLGTVPAGTTSYSVGTLNAGQTYVFAVTAINTDGISSVQTSNTYTVQAATPTPKTPSAPTGLTVTVK